MRQTSFFASPRLDVGLRHLALVKGPGGADAVIKAALTPETAEELETEWQAYEALSSLQGTVIPIGFAKGRVSMVIDELDAIAMEYISGDPGLLTAGRISSETRKSVWVLFQKIWEKKVVHGDVAFRNIGRRDTGELVLLDFGCSMVKATNADIAQEQSEVQELLKRASEEDTGFIVDLEDTSEAMDL
jgi:tRNA A-37 threonylcarbamoyl transferase component Bud32